MNKKRALYLVIAITTIVIIISSFIFYRQNFGYEHPQLANQDIKFTNNFELINENKIYKVEKNQYDETYIVTPNLSFDNEFFKKIFNGNFDINDFNLKEMFNFNIDNLNLIKLYKSDIIFFFENKKDEFYEKEVAEMINIHSQNYNILKKENNGFINVVDGVREFSFYKKENEQKYGWYKIEGKWRFFVPYLKDFYYMYNPRYIKSQSIRIDNILYFFDSNGGLIENEGWNYDNNKNKYMYNLKGNFGRLSNCIAKIDNKLYKFDDEGYLEKEINSLDDLELN